MCQVEISLKPGSASLVEAAGSESAVLITLTPSNSVTNKLSSNFYESQIQNSIRNINLNWKILQNYKYKKNVTGSIYYRTAKLT